MSGCPCVQKTRHQQGDLKNKFDVKINLSIYKSQLKTATGLTRVLIKGFISLKRRLSGTELCHFCDQKCLNSGPNSNGCPNRAFRRKQKVECKVHQRLRRSYNCRFSIY